MIAAGGCGGGSAATRTTSSTRAGSETATSATIQRRRWTSQTAAVCRQERTALARLGYIQITQGGIARVGLPAVKRVLDRYLERLLGVMRRFADRRQRLSAPPSLSAPLSEAAALDRQTQRATVRLQRAVDRTTTSAGLTAAFRVWIATTRQLSSRGDALAQRLAVPGCWSAGGARA